MNDIVGALTKAKVERGVDIEIITAKRRDQPVYKTFLNADLFANLISVDIKIYEEMFTFLHMKAIVVDDKIVNTGSINFDECSFYLNNEANIIMKSEKVASQFNGTFEWLKDSCREVNRYERYSWADAATI